VMRRFWSHMARRAKNEEGFTLIELLVVLAILAVLAAVAIPRVMTTRGDAEQTRNQANQAIYQSAVERYNIDNGEWPTTTDGHVDFALLADDGNGHSYIVQAPGDATHWLIDGTGHVTYN